MRQLRVIIAACTSSVIAFALFGATITAGEKDKKGTATGVLTAKEKNKFIEVKADGEEKARKYFFHMGGAKKLHEIIDETPIGSRVRIDWVFIERHRVVGMEVLKKAEK